MIFDTVAQFLTPEIRQVMVIAGIVFALLHVMAALFIFRQVLTASSLVHTPNAWFVRLVSVIHVALVIFVLVLIIIY